MPNVRTSKSFVFESTAILITVLATVAHFGCGNARNSRIKRILRREHQGVVLSPAFSPRGTMLAFHGLLNIEVWDLETGKLSAVLDDYAVPDMVAFSPDDKWLASLELATWHVKLWNTETGRLRRVIEMQRDEEHESKRSFLEKGIAFSPDGSWLGAAGVGIRLWDTNVADSVRWDAYPRKLELADGTGPIALSRENAIAGLGKNAGQVSIWDMNTGVLIKEFGDDEDNTHISSLLFSPNGDILAGSIGPKVKLWDAHTGQVKRILASPHGKCCLGSLAFSPNGELVACRDSDTKSLYSYIYIWNLETGLEFTVQDTENTDAVAFTPDGGLVSCDTHGTVVFWNIGEMYRGMASK